MRVSFICMIAGTYMLFIASSASSAPIFQFIDNSASKSGFHCSCPMRHFLISLDSLNGDNSSLYFPLAQSSGDAHVIEPKMVLAGMWVLQSADVAALGEAGKQFEELLIPLFTGGLLIGLSGFIKMLLKKKPLTHHDKTPVKVNVSYPKTLWAESNGLM
jgi:hypothetical protein